MDEDLKRLRAAAFEKVRGICRDSGDSLQPDSLDQIKQLSSTIEAIDKLARRPTKLVALTIKLSIAAALVLIILYSLRVPSATFSAHILANPVAFTTEEQSLLQVPAALTELIIASEQDAVRLSLPPDASKLKGAIDLLKIGPQDDEVRTRLTITSFSLPQAATVQLERTETGVQINVEHPQGPIRIDATVPSDYIAEATRMDTTDNFQPKVAWPLSIEVRPSASTQILTRSKQGSDISFRPSVSLLDTRFEEVIDDGHTRPIRVPSVIDGEVIVSTPGGGSYELRPGDRLALDLHSHSVGSIRIRPSAIELSIRGTARDIRVSSAGAEWNGRPRILNWLRAEQDASLLWAAFAYVVLLLTGILRWLATNE